MDHKDRAADQEEIKNFIAKIFQGRSEISFDQYMEINKKVSSELFCSLMSTLHERLPCSQNFFRLKKIYRTKIQGVLNIRKSVSPVKTLASPSIMRGFHSLNKNMIMHEPMTPSVKDIKNKILIIDQRRKGSVLTTSSFSSQIHSQFKSSSGFEEDVQQQPADDCATDNRIPLNLGSPTQKRGMFMTIRNSRESLTSSPMSPGMKNCVRVNTNKKNQ